MPSMPGTYRPPYAPPREERAREYRQARDPGRSKLYTSRWSKASIGFLKRVGVCPACEAAGITAVAVVTDHVIPHRGDRALFWSRDNWQGCCKWHHDVVKQRLERLWRAGRCSDADLILTSPAAMRLAARLRIGVSGGALAGRGGG